MRKTYRTTNWAEYTVSLKARGIDGVTGRSDAVVDRAQWQAAPNFLTLRLSVLPEHQVLVWSMAKNAKAKTWSLCLR